MTFTATILRKDDYSKEEYLNGLTIEPVSWSGAWDVGYKDAQIDIKGGRQDLLRLFGQINSGVKIENDAGSVVWLGYVWEITLNLGFQRYVFSMDDLANKVLAKYTAISVDGEVESYDTDWVEDDYSQAIYGVQELQISIEGESDLTAANQRAAVELDLRRLPQVRREAGDGGHWAQLNCVGLIKEIDGPYINTPIGRTEYLETGGTTHALGWQQSTTTAGFSDNGDGNVGAFSDFTATLPPGGVGESFYVTSSLYNNGTYTIVERAAEEVQTLSTDDDGAGFRWDAASGQYLVEEVTDGLGFLGVGQQIDIDITTSSQKDSGNYIGYGGGEDYELYKPNWSFEGMVGSTSEGKFAVRETGSERVKCDRGDRDSDDTDTDTGGVDDHPTVGDGFLHGTLTAAPYLIVSPKPSNDELQDDATNYSVTVVGEKVAQQINLDSNGGGLLWKVAIRLGKVGTPTDNVQASIYSDIGGFPGALLASGTISESDVSTEIVERWIEMDSPGTVTLASSTSYHLVIERTSTKDPLNYWIVDIVDDADLLYDDELKYYRSGSGWSTRDTAASLPFRVWTGLDSTAMIKSIIDTHSDRIQGCDVQAEAGLLVNPYTDGTQKAGDVVAELLQMGTSNDRHLMLSIDPLSRRYTIKEQPDGTLSKRLTISEDGQLQEGTMPIIAGELRFGEWANDLGAPDQPAHLTSLNPVMISGIRFAARDNRYTIESPTDRDIFDTGYADG